MKSKYSPLLEKGKKKERQRKNVQTPCQTDGPTFDTSGRSET